MVTNATSSQKVGRNNRENVSRSLPQARLSLFFFFFFFSSSAPLTETSPSTPISLARRFLLFSPLAGASEEDLSRALA